MRYKVDSTHLFMLQRAVCRILACALLVFFLCNQARSQNTEAEIGGEYKKIDSYPHTPILSVGTVTNLRLHYEELKEFLPPMPFKMGVWWIIPGRNNQFRYFYDYPAKYETFSSNGDYVVTYDLHHEFEFISRSNRFSLMSTDGQIIWAQENGPVQFWVTDDGRVIGNRSYPGPTILTFYDKAGKVEKVLDMEKMGIRLDIYGVRIRLLSREKILLVYDRSQAVGFDLNSNYLWRYQPGSEAATDKEAMPNNGFYLISKMDADPLGRGLYAAIVHINAQPKNESTIELIDPISGKAVGAVWKRQPLEIPHFFSPNGRYAGTSSQNGISLIDWRTGNVAFAKKGYGADSIATYGDASSVSDDPPCFALSGDKVFDAKGDLIWQLRVGDVGYRKFVISSDAKRAAVIPMTVVNGQPSAVLGFLLYEVKPQTKP